MFIKLNKTNMEKLNKTNMEKLKKIESIINQLSIETQKTILYIKLMKNKKEIHYNLIDLLTNYLMQFNAMKNEIE